MGALFARRRCLALLAVFALCFETAHSVRCYRCISTNNTHPFQCNEFLSGDYDIQPESCDDIHQAKYCVKHVGRFEGGIGTKRFCSAVHMGNYCDYVKQNGDQLNYRTCVYTCSGNGCNPAVAVAPSRIFQIFVPTAAFTIFTTLLRR